MVMMFPIVLVVSKVERYSISQVGERRNNSVGVTNARKAHQRETNFPIIPQLLYDGPLDNCHYCGLFIYAFCMFRSEMKTNFETYIAWIKIVHGCFWSRWKFKDSWRQQRGGRGGWWWWKSETTQLLSLHCSRLPTIYLDHLMPPCAKGRFNFFADHFFQHPLINYKHPSARLVGNWTTKICDDQSLCFCDDCEDDRCRYFIDNVKKVWTRNSSDHWPGHILRLSLCYLYICENDYVAALIMLVMMMLRILPMLQGSTQGSVWMIPCQGHMLERNWGTLECSSDDDDDDEDDGAGLVMMMNLMTQIA